MAFVVGVASAQPPTEPEIGDRGLPPLQTDTIDRGHLVVRFASGTSPSAIRSLNASHGVAVANVHPRSMLYRLQLPPQANAEQVLQAFQRNPLVEEAGFNYVGQLLETPNDVHYPQQWHLHDTTGGMWASSAWDAGSALGSGVVVAVVDTGVAYENYERAAGAGLPALSFRVSPDLDATTFVSPWNFIYDDSHANDDHGHGTHVAGTVSQDTNDSYGTAGVARNASIMPVKVLNYAGSGNSDDIAEAIYYATDNGADVINMSLGFSGTGGTSENGTVCEEIVGLGAALEYSDQRGVVVVAAAGNDGGIVNCPAAYPTVIAVGATDYAGQVSSYSSRGSALDIAAPGGDPNADLNGDGYSDGVLQSSYCTSGTFIILSGGTFDQFCSIFMSGTSMASPHVAGVAALLLGEDSTLSPAEVRHYLETTARDRGATGWDSLFGWGVLDARAALNALVGVSPTPTVTASTPTPSPTVAPSATAEPTVTATPASDATPSPTPCPQGWVKRGLCSPGESTPTPTPDGQATPTPTPTLDPPGDATATPTPCPQGWIKQGRCQ